MSSTKESASWTGPSHGLLDPHWGVNGLHMASAFDAGERYAIGPVRGNGSFGMVRKAVDRRTGQPVAIKRISNVFVNNLECRKVLREVRLLQHFSHENILSLHDLLLRGTAPADEDIYLVTSLMDTDLHYVIHSRQPLKCDHIQYFLYQILRGLKAIHSAGVMHRDLKPSNILVNKDCEIKICDFGLSRAVGPTDEGAPPQQLTEYVVTRWCVYAPPSPPSCVRRPFQPLLV